MRKILVSLLLVWYSFSGHTQNFQNYPYDYEIYATVHAGGNIYSIAGGESGAEHFLSYNEGNWDVLDEFERFFYEYHQQITIWQGLPVVFERYSYLDSVRVVRYLADGSKELVLDGYWFGYSTIIDTSDCSIGSLSRYGTLRPGHNGEILQVFVSTIGGSGYNGGPGGAFRYVVSENDTVFECLGWGTKYNDAVLIADNDFWLTGSDSYSDSGIEYLTHHTESGIETFNKEELPNNVKNFSVHSIDQFGGTLYLSGYDEEKDEHVLVTYTNNTWSVQRLPEEMQRDLGTLLFEIDRKGNLWFYYADYMADKGLFCYNGEEFRKFTTAEGLIHNDVNHIFIDEDNGIWISTPAGISHLDGNVLSLDKSYSQKSFSFYPNPTREAIRLEEYGEFQFYKLFNSAGDLVQEGEVSEEITFPGLTKGFYNLVFSSPGIGLVAKKLVIY